VTSSSAGFAMRAMSVPTGLTTKKKIAASTATNEITSVMNAP
jgi:hypothetical protein